jgi:hypothetical protein
MYVPQWVDELLEPMQRSNGRAAHFWESPSILCVPAENEGDARGLRRTPGSSRTDAPAKVVHGS